MRLLLEHSHGVEALEWHKSVLFLPVPGDVLRLYGHQGHTTWIVRRRDFDIDRSGEFPTVCRIGVDPFGEEEK